MLSSRVILPIFILLLSLALRTYRLPTTMNYASDQGEFLLDSAQIINGQPFKLIGIYVSSKPVEGKYFFTGSQFEYLLAFLQSITNYDPLKITYFFAFFNSLAVVFTFLALRRVANPLVSSLVSIAYAANPFAINYSKIIWNPAILPLLASIILLLVTRVRKKPLLASLLSGLLCGLAISAEYGSLVFVPVIALFLLIPSLKRRPLILPVTSTFILGIILGLSNLLLFDLRHSFYNSQLLLKYFLTSKNAGVDTHHLLIFLPVIFYLAGIFFAKIKSRKLLFVTFLVTIVTEVTISRSFLLETNGFRMPKNTTYPDLAFAASVIRTDKPLNFNVAQTIDGNARAYGLRYLLSYPKGLKNHLRDVDQYSKSSALYVLHYSDQNIAVGGPYELSSFGNRTLVWSQPVNQYLKLSKFFPTP